MNEFTPERYDYGICEFCGEPIEKYESEIHIRIRGEYETRVSHEECWNDYLEEIEEWTWKMKNF